MFSLYYNPSVTLSRATSLCTREAFNKRFANASPGEAELAKVFFSGGTLNIGRVVVGTLLPIEIPTICHMFAQTLLSTLSKENNILVCLEIISMSDIGFGEMKEKLSLADNDLRSALDELTAVNVVIEKIQVLSIVFRKFVSDKMKLRTGIPVMERLRSA